MMTKVLVLLGVVLAAVVFIEARSVSGTGKEIMKRTLQSLISKRVKGSQNALAGKKRQDDDNNDDSDQTVDTTGWIHLFDTCFLPPTFPYQLDEKVSFTVSFDEEQQKALQDEIDDLNLEILYAFLYGEPSTKETVLLWPGCTINTEVAENVEPILDEMFDNDCDDGQSQEGGYGDQGDEDSNEGGSRFGPHGESSATGGHDGHGESSAIGGHGGHGESSATGGHDGHGSPNDNSDDSDEIPSWLFGKKRAQNSELLKKALSKLRSIRR